MLTARNWRRLLPPIIALCLGVSAPAWARSYESASINHSHQGTSHSHKKTQDKRKEHKPRKPKAAKAPKAAKQNSPPPVYHASESRSDRCNSCERDGDGRIVRSDKAKQAFKKQSGYPKGRGGYVIDHIIPLACGGKDVPSNMQWQTKEAARAKDKQERTRCHP